ncbi:unnamed protein product [Rotaria socialis]|uniref:Inositol phosphatase domain-containing protein n=1 Tax=Rotaria socialis TaxID=392032 RepID=A0A818IVB0_9BILA|nr:unnamed protein product [Rotaria socialis]CAF3529039.1 unnamed protein product [Rotaria socialis]CAF3612834.1 unnamed protein product [Rotaria socialis]CAF3785617.1 unnamed protein product [Rotaria socialis]CAF4454201.1 unnamed protein product [Rotaria socialis]
MATVPLANVTTIEQLSVSNPSYTSDPNDPSDKPIEDDDILPPMAFNRQTRPQSARTTRSTTSRSSVNNLDGRIACHDFHASRYFSYRDQGFEKAIFNIQKGYFPNLEFTPEYRDGLMKRSWLLIDIDHWNLHREVIVILMENHVLIVRYNFIRERVIYSQAILFDDISAVTFGPCSYPDKSLMGEYLYGGIKITHGAAPSFFTRWSPTAQTNVHIFVSHHLAYNEKERETVYYNCDEFIQSLDMALTAYRRAKSLEPIGFVEDKIIIPSYANVWSVLFNQNYFGFNRDRNGAKW